MLTTEAKTVKEKENICLKDSFLAHGALTSIIDMKVLHILVEKQHKNKNNKMKFNTNILCFKTLLLLFFLIDLFFLDP